MMAFPNLWLSTNSVFLKKMLPSGFLKLFCFVLFLAITQHGEMSLNECFPNRLKNSHSGEGPNKKATTSSQLEHFRERAAWLVEMSPISWQELFTSTYWHAYQNFHLLVLSHWDVLLFFFPTPKSHSIPSHELTDCELSLSWIGIFP